MVECNPNATSIVNLFSNIKCINPVTIWFFMIIFSAIFASLTGILLYRNSYNKALKAVFIYFCLLVGFSLCMLGISHAWTSSVITSVALIISFIILTFIAQYAWQKKGVCEPVDDKKNKKK